VTPASHEKIPGCLSRKGAKVTATAAATEPGPEEQAKEKYGDNGQPQV